MNVGDPVRLSADRDEPVLNALRLSPVQRRHVHITVGAVGAFAELRVADSGPG
jgi:signal transduction histidine kinase